MKDSFIMKVYFIEKASLLFRVCASLSAIACLLLALSVKVNQT